MFNKKRYTEEDMTEAVAKATGMGYNFGYWKCMEDARNGQTISIYDGVPFWPSDWLKDNYDEGSSKEMNPNPCFTVLQATAILQKDESQRGEL